MTPLGPTSLGKHWCPWCEWGSFSLRAISPPWWQGGTVSQLFLNSFKIFLNFFKTLTIASRWGSVWAVYVFVNDDVFWCTSLYFELLLNDHRYSWPLIWFPTNLVLMLDSYGKSRISWMLTPPTARVRSRVLGQPLECASILGLILCWRQTSLPGNGF